jgi:hypothetical protein
MNRVNVPLKAYTGRILQSINAPHFGPTLNIEAAKSIEKHGLG